MKKFHSTESKDFVNSPSLFPIKKSGSYLSKIKRFSFFTALLFCFLSFLNPLKSAGQEFEITMTPTPSGTFNYFLNFITSNSCLVCNRVCWKWNGSSCQALTPGPTNQLPFTLPASDWQPYGCNNHKYRITDTCANQYIEVYLTTDNKWTYTYEKKYSCDSYTWIKNGVTYTASGIYTHSYVQPIGDTTESTIDLSINYSTSATTSATACDSYTWSVNGVTYTASGTYTQTSLNASGCTHTEILILTINNSSTASFTASACNSYTWNGATYTLSGTYVYTSLNASGCVNTESLYLTINSNGSIACVPTLSEWSLIILFLLSLSSGLVFMYRKERTLSFANGNIKDNQMPLLDKELFTKVLLAMMTLLSIIGAFVFKINGSISITDLIGSVLASFILAFMIQLFLLMKRFEKKG